MIQFDYSASIIIPFVIISNDINQIRPWVLECDTDISFSGSFPGKQITKDNSYTQKRLKARRKAF